MVAAREGDTQLSARRREVGVDSQRVLEEICRQIETLRVVDLVEQAQRTQIEVVRTGRCWLSGHQPPCFLAQARRKTIGDFKSGLLHAVEELLGRTLEAALPEERSSPNVTQAGLNAQVVAYPDHLPIE